MINNMTLNEEDRRITLIYPTMITEAPSVIAMIGAVFREEGFGVNPVINTFRKPLDIDDYLKRVRSYNSKIVGISMLTFQVLKTYELLQALKDEGFYVVVGGPHATDCPEEVIRYGADLVVRNEAENTLRELCQCWRGEGGKLEHIHGLTFFSEESGKIVSTPGRMRITDLSTLPMPDMEIFNKEDFRMSDGLIKGFHRLYTSRGCPGRCTFCDWEVFGQRVSYHSIPVLVDEIQRRIDEYGITSFSIADDCFTVNKRRVFEFCELVTSKLSQPIVWRCGSRANLVLGQDRPEMLKAMREAGCHLITFGLESGDPESLERMEKQITLEQNLLAPKVAFEAGLQVYANLMIGFPWETPESVSNTIKLVEELWDEVYLFQVSGSLVPFPGAGIYKEYAEHYGFEKFWLNPEYNHVGIQLYQNEQNPYSVSTCYQRNMGSSTLMYGKEVGSNAQIHLIEHMFTITNCSETYHGHYHTVKGSRLSRPMHRVC